MNPRESPREAAVFEVRIPSRPVTLEAEARVPAGATGLVGFAHGSGSGRGSGGRGRRNRFAARALESAGLATLLLDLLTAREEEEDARTAHLRFDIELLAHRVSDALRWAEDEPVLRGLSKGLFGASTGAAAALVAAAEFPDRVAAVVSRGGRPDLAGDALEHVRAPTLLVVGGLDGVVIDLNREALARLRGEKRLEIVPGAGHLFEEPGALERVADLATRWFSTHLGSRRAPAEAT